MKNGGQIPWNALPVCETIKMSCLKGPIIPFGSLVEYYPTSAKDQSRIHQLERKSYLDCSLDTLCTRGEFGRVT